MSWQQIGVVVAIVMAILGAFMYGRTFSHYDSQIPKPEAPSKPELLQQIAFLKSEIQQREERIGESKDQLARKSSDLELATKKCRQELREQEANCAKQNKELEAQISTAQETITGLKKESSAKTEEINRLKKEIERLRAGIPRAPPGEPHRQPIPRPSPQMPSATGDDFTFEAVACRKSGTAIHLGIRVTNNRSYEQLVVIGARGRTAQASFLFDGQGNKYQASQVRFGNESARDQVEQHLPPRIPMAVEIVFENVNDVGNQVSVQVGSATTRWGGGNLNPVLRDIPLSK